MVEKEVFRLPRSTTLSMTISIGLTQHTEHPNPLKLLNRADEALHLAKGQGRNRVIIAE